MKMDMSFGYPKALKISAEGIAERQEAIAMAPGIFQHSDKN